MKWLVCLAGKHGESEPRSVSAHKWALTAWLWCCKRHWLATATPPEASLLVTTPTSCGLLLALSAQRHGDFPHSNYGSDLPVVRCEAVLLLPPKSKQIFCIYKKYGSAGEFLNNLDALSPPKRNNTYSRPAPYLRNIFLPETKSP